MTAAATTRIDRIAAVLRHIGGMAANGVRSIHVDDVLDDGSAIRTEIADILRTRSDADDADVIAALDTIAGVWDSGYDMASTEDFATDDLTVGAIVETYLAEHDAPSL